MDIGQIRISFKKCPVCGKPIIGAPALSRKGDYEICTECGWREALEAWGVVGEDQDRIIKKIRDYERATRK